MTASQMGLAVSEARPGVPGLLSEFGRLALLTANRKQSRSMVEIVRRFLWAEGINHGSQLTRAAVGRYLARLAARGRARKTVLNHRSAIRSFCRFLADRGLLEGNPCAGIRVRPADENLPRYLEPEELETVLRLARRLGIWPEICLAVSTGLRLSEIIRLQWSDVDVTRRCLTVRKSKSHRPRVIPLSRSALAALEEQRARSGAFHQVFPARRTWRGGWRFVDSPRTENWWKRASRPLQAAVPKFTSVIGTGRAWHLFRHTFASRLAQARPGISPRKLAEWLGHRDLRTVAVYAHLAEGYDPDIEAAAPCVADCGT